MLDQRKVQFPLGAPSAYPRWDCGAKLLKEVVSAFHQFGGRQGPGEELHRPAGVGKGGAEFARHVAFYAERIGRPVLAEGRHPFGCLHRGHRAMEQVCPQRFAVARGLAALTLGHRRRLEQAEADAFGVGVEARDGAAEDERLAPIETEPLGNDGGPQGEEGRPVDADRGEHGGSLRRLTCHPRVATVSGMLSLHDRYEVTGSSASSEQVVDAWGGEARDYHIRRNTFTALCGRCTKIVRESRRTLGCGVQGMSVNKSGYASTTCREMWSLSATFIIESLGLPYPSTGGQALAILSSHPSDPEKKLATPSITSFKLLMSMLGC